VILQLSLPHNPTEVTAGERLLNQRGVSMNDLELKKRTEGLDDENLARVTGGLNPQPLPPRQEFKLSENVYRIPALR
jgi:hypothetical protein